MTPPSPLLALPGVVAVEEGPDVGLPLHHGDPQVEQRAMSRSAAVVDRSNREVIVVPGEDRLSWLHLLLTQHVSELPADSGTEALVLDLNGRVEFHAVLSHVADTVWLDVEPGTSAGLLEYLEKMKFWSKVEPHSATEEFAVLSVVGPDTAEVLAKAGVPVPERPYGSAALPGGGLVRRMPGLGDEPGAASADLLVPRAELVDWWLKLRDAGAAAAGTMAYEALRVAALRPRLHQDTDERTIPHEARWIGTAVHLDKGCYRGQETVSKVENVGRPPRRMLLLHLDGSLDALPETGDPVLLDGKAVGRIGTAVRHHELGLIALALIKRSVPLDAALVTGPSEEPIAASIDPDSVPPDNAALGREAVRNLGR